MKSSSSFLCNVQPGQVIQVVIDDDKKKLHKVSIEIKQVLPIEEKFQRVMNDIFQERIRCVSRHFTIKCKPFLGILDTIDVFYLPKQEIRLRNGFYHDYRCSKPITGIYRYDEEKMASLFEETDKDMLYLLEDLNTRKIEIEDQIDKINSDLDDIHKKKRQEFLKLIN